MEFNLRFQEWMEDSLPYFHTHFILDFVHGIYRKINISSVGLHFLFFFHLQFLFRSELNFYLNFYV